MSKAARLTHYCDVCGKVFHWDRDSSYLMFLFGSGYLGYERNFVTCSGACREHPEAKMYEWLRACGKDDAKARKAMAAKGFTPPAIVASQ